MGQSQYHYRGRASTAGYFDGGFCLIPAFKTWLSKVLQQNIDSDVVCTIRIKGNKTHHIVRFKNGKPRSPRR